MKYAAILVLFLSAVASGEGPRVFITPQPTWADANAVPTTAVLAPSKTQQIKSLNKACPSAVITEDQSKADFVIAWENKTWQQTPWGGHQNEFVVYAPDKTVIATGDAHHIGNAAKDICKIITAKR